MVKQSKKRRHNQATQVGKQCELSTSCLPCQTPGAPVPQRRAGEASPQRSNLAFHHSGCRGIYILPSFFFFFLISHTTLYLALKKKVSLAVSSSLNEVKNIGGGEDQDLGSNMSPSACLLYDLGWLSSLLCGHSSLSGKRVCTEVPAMFTVAAGAQYLERCLGHRLTNTCELLLKKKKKTFLFL